MFSKTAILALTIVGTVTAAVRPNIPRWISADKYGSAYILLNNWNGTYSYEVSASFSWDFDYNCARAYAYSYSTYDWAESSYCNNKMTEYSSTQGSCQTENVGYIDLEEQVKAELDQFTISWGSGYADPVWSYGNYHVLEHKSDYTYIYMRPSDNAIEYIVESYPNYQADVVTYYPYGLSVDNSTYGVWDYELRYASCANNASSFLSNKIFHQGKSLAAKPALEKPTLAGKPTVAAAAVSPLGGVRSLFAAKPKSMIGAPNKETFVIAKDQVAEKVPMNLFKASVAPKADKKLQSLFKAKPTDDVRFAAVKAYIQNFKPETLASNDLQAEVDEAYAVVDTNRDGFITPAELKAAIQAEGKPVTDEEIQFVFLLIDANQDGKLSWNECYNFAKSQGGLNVSLYTRSEKVNIIFQYYDTNKDGFLNKAEVKRLLVDSYGAATDADAQWFIALVDSNWDGKISWYELYYAIQE